MAEIITGGKKGLTCDGVPSVHQDIMFHILIATMVFELRELKEKEEHEPAMTWTESDSFMNFDAHRFHMLNTMKSLKVETESKNWIS